jgi:glycine/D-amino acid oxidase-like deaminating enzyme
VASRPARRALSRPAWIDADRAVVATGYATPEFKPLWDTERPYHYLRWTPDHRILFGGLDRRRVPRGTRPAALRQRTSQLTAELVELYPALEGMRAEFAWEGLFATTPDGLPYIGTHRHYPRHLFALGYGGNGMTLGFLAAQMLVRMAQGRAVPDDELFGFGR